METNCDRLRSRCSVSISETSQPDIDGPDGKAPCLALTIVQGPDDLLHTCAVIHAMDHIDIDVIRLQPPQRCIDTLR